ncbi:MAG: flagellar filament capping protein FliD, partial [Comamonadaceae bacterium]
GTYAINVTQLSQAQSLATLGVASSTERIGAGMPGSATIVPTFVMFDFGKISGTLNTDGKYDTGATFSPVALPAVTSTNSITIDSTNNTLEGIRDAINASTTIGVSASIVNDGGVLPSRLVLTSKTSGETSSMRITVSAGGDAKVATLLANNPVGGVQNAQLQQTTVAQNTKLTVNGIAVTSATNSVAGAVQDVTMTVAKLGTSTLTVAKDTSSVQSAITTFVNAYNSLQTVSKQLSAFDATKKTGAALLGDSVLRNIQVGIRSALTSPQIASSGLTMLSDIGVSFQKDGTLATDATKLTAALGSKLSGVANLFSGSAGVGGYGTQLAALITTYTDATTGTLTSATKGINSSLDKLSTQYTAATGRIDATVARYKAQFTQLDQMISRMNQTSSYLTQQFDAINNSTSK